MLTFLRTRVRCAEVLADRTRRRETRPHRTVLCLRPQSTRTTYTPRPQSGATTYTVWPARVVLGGGCVAEMFMPR
jgi:hypothetical protein